jgi:phosphoribosylanthranilate isomerase
VSAATGSDVPAAAPLRVKICGLTREEDVAAAVRAGADAIGLVFVPGSPRNVTVEQAQGLACHVPAFVSVVGLFLDAPAARVDEVIARVPLDLLQFHGTESAEYCDRFGRRYIKAIGKTIGRATGKSTGTPRAHDVHGAEKAWPDCAALLFDSHVPGELGGTGKPFDWDAIGDVGKPVILAGGLNADNVREAVRRVRPWAVDVSSGVESSPGIKDAGKIRRFIRQAREIDCS